jgi:GNAT superfamily N-acetyltransferase
MNFHKVSLNDREWIVRRLKEEQPEACEYTFVNNYVWRKAYRVEVAEYEGCGIIRYYDFGKCMYSYPFGNGDKKAAITALKAECSKEGYALSMCPLTEKHCKELKSFFPKEFFIIPDRDDFDYVYSKDKLAELKGKKYHGKRNHIARFKDADDWSYEHITDDNLEECRLMHREWITFREDKWDSGVAEETEALHEAFDHYREFGLVGGLVRKAGQIVAFAIGEPLNDETMVVHFEKAYPDMQGAYPMINQQFVINECADYKYINREEDTGDEGLRKAKLSYYPEILLKKYIATQSRVTFADKGDFEDIKILWSICFGDEADYIDFYLENRFDDENMIVIREDGRVVSMTSFLPATLKQGEEYVPVRYAYAVATLPEYRKRGYASEILKLASQIYKEPIVLQPENDELRKYYKNVGFKDFFGKEAWETDISENISGLNSAVNDIEVTDITAGEYKRLRDMHFDREGYLNWSEEAVEYALKENKLCGGMAIRVNTDDIIMIYPQNDTLHIVESSLSKEQIVQLAPQLKQIFKDAVKIAYDNKGGMILSASVNEDKSEGYINLTLG